MNQECPVEGCWARYDSTSYVMCRSCWRRVPRDLAARVYDAWRRRLGRGDDRSVEIHEQVKREAIDYVSQKRRAANAQAKLDV